MTVKSSACLKSLRYSSLVPGHPLRENAFALGEEEKISKISGHFRAILETLGLDLEDDSLKDTPRRVAKMYVKEIFSGLNPANRPEPSLFENSYSYGQMLIEKNISLYSNCEHHFVPIIGRVHVAYISSGKVIGLSKINRIVDYYGRRPQVQERLTMQIAGHLVEVLETPDVGVIIDAEHLCVSSRGIRDRGCSTVTAAYEGQFARPETRDEFLKNIRNA